MSLTQKEVEWHRKNYGNYLLKELSDEIYSITDDPRKSLLDIANKLQEAKPYLIAKDYLKLRMDLHKLTHGMKVQLDVQGDINVKGYEMLSPDMFPDKIIDVHTNTE